MNELIKKRADSIIKEVQETTTDFQSTVFYEDIQEKFAKEIEEEIYSLVEIELASREEIADVTLDTDGFDIVLYTDFSPNYESQ